MKEPLLHVQLTLNEAKRIVQLLYDRGTAKDVDAVRAFEAAIDDAMIEIYQNEDQHQ